MKEKLILTSGTGVTDGVCVGVAVMLAVCEGVCEGVCVAVRDMLDVVEAVFDGVCETVPEPDGVELGVTLDVADAGVVQALLPGS